MQTTNAAGHQLDTLRLYGALVTAQLEWGGRLVLCCGAGSAISGAPAAASIAGGVSLAIDSDAASAKAAMRAGELDFVVNTLDEAMRTLKNQVRQRRPLSVGLIADTDLTLAELVERGILPDLLLVPGQQSAQPLLQNMSIRALETEGMPVRLMAHPADEQPGMPSTTPAANRPDEIFLPAPNAVELRSLDDRLLSLLPANDLVRRRWVQQVPKYLREARTAGRWIWLSEEERQRLAE